MFRKFVSVVIVFAAPVIKMAYAVPNVVSVSTVTLPVSVTVPVCPAPAPLPRVKPNALAPSVTAPVVIVPEPARSVVSASSVMSPKKIAEFVVSITPARFTAEGATAVRPVPKVLVPPAVPSVRLPVFEKLAFISELVAPPSTTLKTPAAEFTDPLANVMLPVIVAVPVCEALPRLRTKAPGAVRLASVIVLEPLMSVASLTSVTAPKARTVFVVAIVPAILVPEGPDVVRRPPVNANVSPVASPKVTAPVLRKFTLATKVLPEPVMEIVVAVAAVIKSLTVTASVNAADAPLVMVKSVIATVVPVMAPPVPAFKPKLKELTPSVMPAPKRMFAPVAEPPALVVSN